MIEWLKSHKAALAFVVLALAVAFTVQRGNDSSADRLYQNSLASCQRGNVLRQESNSRAPVHEKALVIERRFLLSAAKARRAAYARDHRPEDLQAARSYTGQAKELIGLSFMVVPLVDCEGTVERP